MAPRAKVILGKDTKPDQKYLEVPAKRIAMVEQQNMPMRDKLMAQKVEIEAKIAAIDAKAVTEK